MSRTTKFRCCAGAIVALTASWLPAGTDVQKPNVLFIFTDDQRADTIHALGNDTIITPNTDSLAKRGFVFNNTYCFGSNMEAVCIPSRNMMLSGRAYFRFDQNFASPDKPNFPASMKAAGYETYHHGKEGGSARQMHKRFDHTKYVIHHSILKDGQPGKLIVDDAIGFLSSRAREKPFFMYLALSEPHDPRTPAQEYLDQYKREDIPLPKNYMLMHPFNNGELTVRDETLEAWPRTVEAVRKHLHEYYAFITGMDRHLGRLFQALEKSGQMDSTIVIFASDNGLAIGSHGLMGKQSVYEHSAKVPLIMAGPGIPKGSSDTLVYLMDIFPTVCEVAGDRVPDGLDGCSLLPVVRGEAPKVRETLFYSYKNYQRAIRDDRWKLLCYPQINKIQLFDLQNDSSEMHDLSGNPEQAGRIAKMGEQLREWQKRLGDAQPLKSDNPQPAGIEIGFFKKAPPPGKKQGTLPKAMK